MNCPLCGNRVLYQGLVDIECSGRGCANYRPCPEPEYKGDGVGHQNWIECTWQEAVAFDSAFPGMVEFNYQSPDGLWIWATPHHSWHRNIWRCRFKADAMRDTVDALAHYKGVSP